MEANDHRRREEYDQAILPLLQAPGDQQPHRVTDFYIDNILRPDFGRRRKDRTPGREENADGASRLGDPDGGESKGGTTQRRAGWGGDASSKDLVVRKADVVAPDAPLKPRADSGDQCLSSDSDSGSQSSSAGSSKPMLWPAWVYCTRYSDRPSSGPRSRKPKSTKTTAGAANGGGGSSSGSRDDKRPRTAFTPEQLQRLKTEFQTNRYLTEQRRQVLAGELGLNESQIKIWFQNKRAKIKKATGSKNSLALHLMAQGLYNHSTACRDKSDSE